MDINEMFEGIACVFTRDSHARRKSIKALIVLLDIVSGVPPLFIGDFLFPAPSGSEPEPQRRALNIICDAFLPERDPERNRT